MRHLICLFALMFAACGGKTPGQTDTDDEPTAQCSSNEDCYTGCFGYDTAVCSSEGICFCNDSYLDRGCDLDEECVETCSGYDSHSCSGGVCVCSDPAPVQCSDNSDCASGCGTSIPDCQFGICHCFDEGCPPINRAELVKAVITAIDGLADYEAPATPTFDDVPVDAWFYDYVEAAVQLGIMSGYTDASGNLTGMFGPGDSVNRAAMIKVVVNAFAVPTTLSPASPFSDVLPSAWFHDYVLTAYNQGLFAPSQDGLFHPGDTATSCFLNEVIWQAGNLSEDPVVDPSDPAIVVSLNADTAPSSTLPKGATTVHLASFDLTTTGPAVVLNNLTIRRGGVGSHTDWERIYIFDDNGRSMGYGAIVPDDNSSEMPFGYTLYHRRTTTIHLLGDLSFAAGNSNQHYFYIDAGDLYSIYNVVGGDFPVAGNTMTVGGVTVNTVILSPGPALPDPSVDQDNAEVASILLSAGAGNDIALHKINLVQAGSLDLLWNLDSNTLKLYNGGTLLASGLDNAILLNGHMEFWLPTPFVIPAGEARELTVVADIVDGLPGETIKLFLFDYITDAILVIDQQYGYGAMVDNQLAEGDVTPLTLQ